MTIPQLTIFLENSSGTLSAVLEQMKRSHIQMIACTIADTAEYGVFRIICSEPRRACAELKEAGIAVALSEVFALELDNQPGGAADVVKVLSNAGVNITYMYAFLFGSKGILVFRTEDEKKAREAIAGNSLHYLSEESLG